MRHRNILFVILVLVSTLGQVSADLYLPSLLAISIEFNTSFQAVKFSVAGYMVGFALSPLIYGPISDGIGRHKPLLIGLFLCLLGSVLCVTAQHVYFLIAGRLLQGIGAGAATSLLRPILRDLFHGERLARYSAYAALIGVAGLAFAPLLGGCLQHFFNWRANFLFLIVLTIAAILSIVFIVPETNKHLHPENLTGKKIKANFLLLLQSPIFMGYSFINFFVYGSVLAWLTSAPLLLQDVMGMTPIQFGWVYALTGILFALGAIINGALVRRLGTQHMLQIGLGFIFSAGVLMLVLKLLGFLNVAAIVVPILLLSFGVPLVFSNSFTAAFEPFPKIAGIASALYGAMTSLGGAVSSGLVALCSDSSQSPIALVIMADGLLAWLAYYYITKHRN